MELTKRCTVCNQRKPHTDYYVARIGRQGPVLCPRCKPCECERSRRWRAANRERRNAWRREWIERKRQADPEWWSSRMAYSREFNRVRRGSEPRNLRRWQAPGNGGALLSVAAFGEWLRGLDLRPFEISELTGVDSALLGRLMAVPPRQPYVSVDTVDRACAALGGDLGALYPDWAVANAV